jgi:hypothetical protein
MKKVWVLAVLYLGIGLAFPVSAQEGKNLLSKFEFSGDLAFYSQYVWRGMLLDRDAVLQSGFYITTPESKLGRVQLSIWTSEDLENKDNLKSQEVDYVFDYTYSFKNFDLSFGHTYYDFPDSDAFSREFYLGVSFSNLFLSPSITFYRDYGNEEDGGGNGSYISLDTSYSIPIKNTPLTLDLLGHFGYNHELFINGNGEDLGLGLGITIPLTEKLSCSPSINYSIPFSDLEDKNDGAQKRRFYAGVSFSYEF